MEADRRMRELVLAMVPQVRPFRFIDEILELSETRIVGGYRFRPDEYFYPGHFPGRAITPGVILIETMAQTAVVALGLYLTLRREKTLAQQAPPMLTLFTLAEEVEFNRIVSPGEGVIVTGEKLYFRQNVIKSKVEMKDERGQVICCGRLTGKGVMLNET